MWPYGFASSAIWSVVAQAAVDELLNQAVSVVSYHATVCIKHKKEYFFSKPVLGHPTTSNNMESELANIPMIIKGIGITIKGGG